MGDGLGFNPAAVGEAPAYDRTCHHPAIASSSLSRTPATPAWRSPMSNCQRHRRSKKIKALCASCQQRKARFRYRGEVRADRDHTLCFECHRSEVNRARARLLADRAESGNARARLARLSTTRRFARQIVVRQLLQHHGSDLAAS